MVRRNHVAAAEMPRPMAEPRTSPGECSTIPLPSSISHRASSASGSTASCESPNAATISRGSCRYPSLHNRHIEEIAGGSGSIPCSAGFLGEDVISDSLLFRRLEPLCLQIEHGSIAAAQRHQLVVRAELDHTSLFQDANSVGLTDSGKAMRNQDSSAMPRCCQEPLENLRLAADV